jgi:hypothetical protein
MNSTIKQKTPKQKTCLCPCGEKFTPTGLGQKHISQSHYVKWLTETEEGKKEVAKKMDKAKKQIESKEKKADKELKDIVTNWKKKLQQKINEIVRLIDKGQLCLARQINAGQLHGGHVFSSGANKNFTYNAHNIHRQSAQSNHWQNDDALMKEGLEREYGRSYLLFVTGLKQTPVPKYSNQEYQMFYSLACGISNRLKKAEKEYNLEERIELRNKINLELGIYSEEYCIFVN